MPSRSETSRPPVAMRDELLYRLRQQSLLGEFGRSALQTRDIRQILQRATELCAQGLDAPFAKVLEYLPDEKRLLVRAGVGWHAGTIDHVSLGADVESPAGYAFHTGKIVISNHLQEETRFRTPQFLADQGIRRAINVLIARGGEGHLPFGVLEVDSADPGQFRSCGRRLPGGLRWTARHSHRAAARGCGTSIRPGPPGHADAGDEPPRQEQSRIG